MLEDSVTYLPAFHKFYTWNIMTMLPTGRPKTGWEDDVKRYIQKLKVPNWRTLVQDRRRRKELIEKARTLH
jgi:hypothetical protein